jgi:serine-type D-Ala-D-Ala carboxypeptidase (penicillin-binding protein 5/6)
LVSSANNYADSLARWAFGSRSAFLAATKTWLAAHSLTGTTLLEPTGMNPGNTSTASDLVSIGKLVLADPVLAAIVSTKSVTVPQIGVLTNTNKLLGIDGIDGIKTGTLREAGACLLFAATVPVGSRSVTVVGAVLGGADHHALDAAVRSLLDSVADGFEEVTLTHAGEEFAHYRMPWAGQAAAIADSDETVVAWRGSPVHATVDTVPLRTGLRGAAVGAVTFTIGGRTVKIPLTLDRDIDDPGPWWRLTNP